MAENLKTITYRNGAAIGTTIPYNKDISAETEPKYQWAYDGNENNVPVYGRLYTWYAVADAQCMPCRRHVPTDDEWTTMENYLIANGL
ncbi:MAG: fibrobacter succinogenes major paralogous domain-containing protein [Marinilabiliales bacterium]|nr:fibrobacter succinogenes major paralogous domain-containing protein [Marinilabiliales bacterium]